MAKAIYFDNSATTKISGSALKKYNEVSLENFGNPSSLHAFGFDAEKEIKEAKKTVAASVMEKDATVIFTASGSEANNLAIIGRAYAKERYRAGGKIITTNSEHASVSEPIKKLEGDGFKTAFVPTLAGKVDLSALQKELSGDVILVSVMLVNNETGAIYDVKRISDTVKAKCRGAIIHVDATQAYMKLPFTMRSLGADMITVSSHKIHGPKGVGALIISPAVIKERGLAPIIYGGGQEGGLRSGTENVPGIAAFATAVAEGKANLITNAQKMDTLRAYIVDKLTTTPALAEIRITNPEKHAPHILNITLPAIKSETMLHYLSSRGILVSSGSACSSNTAHHPSHALVAYGISEDDADSSIRISLSHENTNEEADELISALCDGIERLARKK